MTPTSRAQPRAAFSRKNDTTVIRLSFIVGTHSAGESTEFDKLSDTQASQQHDLSFNRTIKLTKMLPHVGDLLDKIAILITHGNHPGLYVWP